MTHTLRPTILWLLAAVLLGGLIYAVSLTIQDQDVTPPATSGQSDETPPAFVAYQPTIVGTRDGVRQWRLEAESMRDGAGQVFLTGIAQGVLYRDGEGYLEFSADQGIWDQYTEDLHLTGDVRVYQDGEQLIATDSLQWKSAAELLIAEGPVTVWHEGTRIDAHGMRGEMADGRLIFEEGVQVETRSGLRLSLPSRLEYDLDGGDLLGLGPIRLEF